MLLQVVGVQPQMPALPPPPHESGRVQPQKSVPPQPLSMLPHWFGPQVFGVQHSSVVVSQIWPLLQRLQLSIPPQLSGRLPPQVVPA